MPSRCYGRPGRNICRRNRRKRKRPMDFDKVNTGTIALASPHEGDLHITDEVSVEPVIKRMFFWCYNKLPSISTPFSYASEILFSTRALRYDLESTRKELYSTKEELVEIMKKLNDLEKNVKALESGSKKGKKVNTIALAPPPPPPPPPPVPLPLPKVQTFTLRKKTTVVDGTKPVKKDEKKQSLCVTIDDIRNVKLKKTRTQDIVDKENKLPASRTGMPRITLADITSISLQKLGDIQQKSGNFEQSNMTTPKSVLLKRTLRKTTMQRSPGGTPIIRRNPELSTATGPTPEFARALRRKFRSIRTSPLAEDVSRQSPS